MRDHQSNSAALEQTFRKSGIDAIGQAGRGTHFCHFYETRQDLIDMLVPYFEAGLRDKESCPWIASDPIGADEAETAMVEALPDFSGYGTKADRERSKQAGFDPHLVKPVAPPALLRAIAVT
jgi:CheY-like chemotaxis protein